MQAIELFAAFVRSADALERIANSLEAISAGGATLGAQPSYTDPDLAGGGQGPNAIGAEAKTTRKRRTKAEVEADEAAKASGVSLPPEVTAALTSAPPVAQSAPPVVQSAPPIVQSAPPIVQSAPPVVQAPDLQVTVAPAADQHMAQYAALSVEQQFTHLLTTFGPYNNVPLVRDALVNQAGACGLALPFSAPENRELPGTQYAQSLTNDQRCSIYAATVAAIQQTKSVATI